MNQSFKKKVVVASIAAAFMAVGAGVVAVPGMAPVGVVHANQFVDTTQVAATVAGVSVPVSATASLGSQSFVITENVGAAISTGNVILTLTNGAKWVGATATDTAVSGGTTSMVIGALSGQGGANLVLPITTASDTGNPQAITISGMTIDTSAMSVGQTVSVSISSSSTSTGVTTGVSTLLGTVAAPGVTVKATETTTPTYPKLGATTIVNTIEVAEVIVGSVKDSSSAVDEITVTLPSGYGFVSGGATGGTDNFTTNDGSIVSNVIKYDVSGTGTTSSAGKVILGATNWVVYIPSSATDGNVDATVAVKLSNGTTATSTVTLFKVASAATTAAAYSTGTTTAPTTYAKLYAGRATQDTTVDVAVKETVGGTLLAGGTVSLTLPTGVTAGKNYAVTTDVFSDGTGVPALSAAVTAADGTADETGLNSIMATLASSDSNTSAGKVTFKLNDLDLADTAVVGDLTVTTGGSAGVSATTAKVAEVIRATSASASGTIPTVTAGSVLSLPDVVITESKAGALSTSATGLGLYIASANGANLTTSSATVKAYKADGTDISSTIFGSSSGATITAGASGAMGFPLTAASSSSTGPVTIKISGLKATVVSTAAAGDITAVVGGMGTLGADTTPTSDEGAKAFKESVVVGKVVSATVPSAVTPVVTGTITSQNIAVGVVPSGNDQGKQGSVFVAAIVPASTGIPGAYFMDSSNNWTPFKDCTTAPSYSSGVLQSVSNINLLKAAADLTVLKGTIIYVGYGVGGALAPAGTSCNNMINNGTYVQAYEIK